MGRCGVEGMGWGALGGGRGYGGDGVGLWGQKEPGGEGGVDKEWGGRAEQGQDGGPFAPPPQVHCPIAVLCMSGGAHSMERPNALPRPQLPPPPPPMSPLCPSPGPDAPPQ